MSMNKHLGSGLLILFMTLDPSAPLANAETALSASTVVPTATISISPGAASVPSGGTQKFTATTNGGTASWGLEITYFTGCFRRCVFHTSSCSGCGTVSPLSTPSGTPTTYTAPHTPYRFPQGAQLPKLLIVAKSGGNSATAVITILPISISVSPNPATVSLKNMQQVMATVTNDGKMRGVTWSLEQNGIACSPACGTITPTKTESGKPATYSAPGSSPELPVVAVVATSVEDPTKSGSGTEILTTSAGHISCSAGSGKEASLKGKYAFMFQAFGIWGGVGVAGSVTANGTGKITAGEEDIILDSGASEVPPTISTTASLYAVGPDHRGCLLLAGTNGTVSFLRFALGSVNAGGTATAGRFIQFYDTTGTQTLAAGSLRLQDPTSFTATHFKGNYALGTVGRTPTLPGTAVVGSLAIAGTFESDGVSAIPVADMDLNLGGSFSNAQSAGTFQCCDNNGRGTGVFSNLNPPTGFVLYQINPMDAFFMLNNDLWGASGEAIGIPSGSIFSESSLNGAAVLRETGQSAAGPVVDLATVSADGGGNLTTNDNVNSAGVFTTSSTPLTYQVASNGRVTLAGISTPPVLHLYGPNQGFLLGTDANVTYGILEPQSGSPFSDSSFSGAYTLGTENPSSATVTLESGIVSADGGGNASGTFDQSSSAGIRQNQTLKINYYISGNGTGNMGSGTTAIVISDSKLAFINNTNPNPTISVVEK
jgi:hypothetical protein